MAPALCAVLSLALVGPVGPVSAAPRAAACTISGTSGDDTLEGTPQDDVICGLAGNDLLLGREGDDVLRGGAGTDTVTYADHSLPVAASLDGSANDGSIGEHDRIAADVERLVGGSAADRLVGNAAANSLRGGQGNDVLIGGSGDDDLRGGPGSDSASYADHTRAVTVRLDGAANDGATGEHDRIASDVERAVGGTAADLLVGDATANALSGGPGPDSIRGGGGADALTGESGGDTLDGGGGDDTLNGGTGADQCISSSGEDLGAGCDNPDGMYGWEGDALVRHGEPLSEFTSLDTMVDSEGRLVGVGAVHLEGNNRDLALFRLTTEGQPDPTFAGGGQTTAPRAGTYSDAMALGIDGEGRLLVAGTTGTDTASTAFLQRFDAAGVPDLTYGDQSVASADLGTLSTAVEVAPIPGGGALLGATRYGGSPFAQAAIAKFTADGDLDPSFATDGVFLQPDWQTTGLAVDPTDGAIWVVGATTSGSPSCATTSAGVLRLTTDGDLDPGFHGGTPLVLAPEGGEGAVMVHAATADDAGLLITGSMSPLPVDGAMEARTMVARIDDSGLDGTFGASGMVLTDLHPGNDLQPPCSSLEHGTSVTIDEAGGVLVGATATDGAVSGRAVLRYLPDGSVDGDFGVAGRFLFEAPTNDTAFTRVRIAGLADDHILAATDTPVGALAVRLSSDGRTRT